METTIIGLLLIFKKYLQYQQRTLDGNIGTPSPNMANLCLLYHLLPLWGLLYCVHNNSALQTWIEINKATIYFFLNQVLIIQDQFTRPMHSLNIYAHLRSYHGKPDSQVSTQCYCWPRYCHPEQASNMTACLTGFIEGKGQVQ